jgi:signal transduction histidine kinase
VAAAREVVGSFDHAAAVAGVEVVLVAPERQLQARADHEQVAQALSPLLENAISHAAGRVSVSIAADNGEIALAVEDDGSGLPATFAQSGFEPGSSTRGSAGLGLPLARRLARACGGDVTAASTPHGARFELRVPRVLR